ncbi:hypothetical protein H072_3286 [Dactylellina haptotyla CBS 200.50]|uniref:CFEM domain-containing protein n=1 Tax=Dactylellina haptotyla (strain CBS 200.50) TaxID=1284197 RepID=S8AIG1_DACHA|nr:hypothetical protein H072_3286 [Dactylellina haptotyla CBS 200.50]
MKFSAVTLVAVAAVASAQSIGDIPACAQTCLLPALQATGCSLTDFKCSCSNKSFVTDSTACILKACSAADAEKAAGATYALCKSVGVTIETQPIPGATTSAAAASSSAAAPTSTEAASSSAAAPSSSAVSSVEAPSSYGAAPTTSAAAPSSYVVPTTVISSTSAGNATQPTQPPAPTYTGAAAVVAGNAILAVGGAIAAFFL